MATIGTAVAMVVASLVIAGPADAALTPTANTPQPWSGTVGFSFQQHVSADGFTEDKGYSYTVNLPSSPGSLADDRDDPALVKNNDPILAYRGFGDSISDFRFSDEITSSDGFCNRAYSVTDAPTEIDVLGVVVGYHPDNIGFDFRNLGAATVSSDTSGPAPGSECQPVDHSSTDLTGVDFSLNGDYTANSCPAGESVATVKSDGDLINPQGLCTVETNGANGLDFERVTITWNLHLNPAWDSDNDGFTDVQELQAGTDPLDENSTPSDSEADLVLAVATGPTPHPVNDPINVTANVTNNGPNVGAGAEATFSFTGVPVDITDLPASCTTAGGGLVSCDLGSLPVGSVTPLDFVVTPTQSGELAATGNVAGTTPDPNSVNNTWAANAAIGSLAADLALTVATGATPHLPEDPIDVKANVTNNGPEAGAGAEVTFSFTGVAVAITDLPASCTTAGAGLVTCGLGALPVGSVTPLDFAVTPTQTGELQASGNVLGTTPDPNSANNTWAANAAINAACALPVAFATATQEANLGVHFVGTASSQPLGSISDYRWTFGDGASAHGAQVTHYYSRPGPYTVTLAVRGSCGNLVTSTQLTVHVTRCVSITPSATAYALPGLNWARVVWTPAHASGCPLTGYDISVSPAANARGQVVHVGPTTSRYDWYGLTPGRTYYFTVTPVTEEGPARVSKTSTAVAPSVVGAPNHCPTRPYHTDAKFDRNPIPGTTDERFEADITWCSSDGVTFPTSAAGQQTTAWDDATSVTVGTLAGTFKAITGYFEKPDPNYPSPRVAWPAHPTSSINVNFSPGVQSCDQTLTLLLDIVPGKLELDVGATIAEHSTQWLVAHEVVLEQEMTKGLWKEIDSSPLLDNPLTEFVFEHTFGSLIDKLGSLLINYIVQNVGHVNIGSYINQLEDDYTACFPPIVNLDRVTLNTNGRAILSMHPRPGGYALTETTKHLI